MKFSLKKIILCRETVDLDWNIGSVLFPRWFLPLYGELSELRRVIRLCRWAAHTHVFRTRTTCDQQLLPWLQLSGGKDTQQGTQQEARLMYVWDVNLHNYCSTDDVFFCYSSFSTECCIFALMFLIALKKWMDPRSFFPSHNF